MQGHGISRIKQDWGTEPFTSLLSELILLVSYETFLYNHVVCGVW